MKNLKINKIIISIIIILNILSVTSFASISEDEENRAGDIFYSKMFNTGEVITNENNLYNVMLKFRSGNVINYLKDPSQRKYKFVLVNDNESVNAFSTPGKYVYTTTKIWSFIHSDSEMNFILGHEVGHVKNKHFVKQVDYNNFLKGDPNKAVKTAEFSRDLEREADKFGFEVLSNDVCFNVAAGMSFFKRLHDDVEANQYNGPSIYADHPEVLERLNTQLQYISTYSDNLVNVINDKVYFNGKYIETGYVVKSHSNVYVHDKTTYDTAYDIAGILARGYHDNKSEMTLTYYTDKDKLLINGNAYDDNTIKCLGRKDELVYNIKKAVQSAGIKFNYIEKEDKPAENHRFGNHEVGENVLFVKSRV